MYAMYSLTKYFEERYSSKNNSGGVLSKSLSILLFEIRANRVVKAVYCTE